MVNHANSIPACLHELAVRQDREEADPNIALDDRLRQVPAETGEFLALMASVSPPGNLYEFGTSGAYSSLWISTGVRERSRVLHTCELLDDKITLAQDTIERTGSEAFIKLYQRDGLAHAKAADKVAFAFIDTPSIHYLPILKTLLPKMVAGGIIVADNAKSHAGELSNFLRFAMSDPRIQGRIVEIGKGEFVGVAY